jgi:uncharacterized PurR-regulated membrane protein YhhQ (DUF165 family)
MPINALISVMVGQIIVKAVITIISIPMIYLVPTKKVYVEDGLAD